MCGIAGFIDNRLEGGGFRETIEQMLNPIRHRGPDNSGIWIDWPVAIGHCRLSVLDLSPRGNQPMVSLSGRYVMAFNGEIYNHASLKSEQEARGWRFVGHSDTEILLSLIEDVGLEQALSRCVGMFAIVLWDSFDRTLKLARDRFGEKPLYYGWHKGRFLFGSELKALMAHPSFCREIDRDALTLLLRFGYIPSPLCIFKNTFKLHQGSILSLSPALEQSRSLTPDTCCQSISPYWSLVDVTAAGMRAPFSGSFTDATRELEALLFDAVRLQMQADVPLGAFLSGGIDSSVIVALMQHQSPRSVKTYSIGFENSRFNEARFAKAVANHLGTEHTELYVTTRDARNVIPLLPEMFDEPLGDSSQIPTYLVAQMARKDVTVSLSGDGGDEMFCGYPRYAYGNRFANGSLRRSLGLVTTISQRFLKNPALKMLATPLADRLGASRFAMLHFLSTASSNRAIAHYLSMIHVDANKITKGAGTQSTIFDAECPAGIEKDYMLFAMLMDKQSYLPDDILVKVDRATMSVSLESRAPFLDHRINEFVARLPLNFLFDGQTSKRILREVLYRHVPKPLIERPKCGFSIPLADWLRGDLREWAMDMLSNDSFDELLDMQHCRDLFRIHCTHKEDLSLVNWTVLSFLSWGQRWL